MLPSIFGESMFDEMFNHAFDFPDVFGGHSPLYGKHAKNLMKTDIRETDSSYELDVDLPGFKKDELQVELEDGYLTISAQKGLDKEQKDDQGRYIRQERYAGSMSRSFYVGQGLTTDDMKARFEDGILKISVPKTTVEALPRKNLLSIE